MLWYFLAFGIPGLALLMVVHELGHLLVARAFGMRVIKFAIGFGPTVWRVQPKGSSTVYQIGLVPFLAYVQIAGMNPFEEIDPEDKGSYANAGLMARISAIFAGPLANYLFASILFFGANMLIGKALVTMHVSVDKGSAAEAAKMQDGDKVVSIEGTPIETWEEMKNLVQSSEGKPLSFVVERDGKNIDLEVVPKLDQHQGHAMIGVRAVQERVPITVREAAILSLEQPAVVVYELVAGLGRILTFQQKPNLMGPVGIVNETGKAAQAGAGWYLLFLGMLSAYFGGFNLVPFPALDGGRLLFLGYEAVTRRRPNARVEAHIHAVGLLMLLTLIAVVTVFDFAKLGGPGPEAAEGPPESSGK